MNNYPDQSSINFHNFNPYGIDENVAAAYNNSPGTQQADVKELLNLHVKRKLLENSTNPVSFSTIDNSAITNPPYYHHHHQTQKLSKKNSSSNVIGAGGTTTTTKPPKEKRTRKSKNNVATPSTSRCASRTGEDGRDGNLNTDISNDNQAGGTSTAPTASGSGTNSKDKNNSSNTPDLLTQILNMKKEALMRDPEIIALLNNMSNKLQQKKSSGGN